jgi:hypothetical protein
MTPPIKNLIDRMADRLFFCECPSCCEARIDRLLRDLEAAYGCTTVAQAQAALRRRVN